MSADNWTVCPACAHRRTQEVEVFREQVRDAYGTIPVAEFDSLRAQLSDMEAKPLPDATFREDYEFYGADGGMVVAVYSGACTACDLSVSFEDSHPFWSPPPARRTSEGSNRASTVQHQLEALGDDAARARHDTDVSSEPDSREVSGASSEHDA